MCPFFCQLKSLEGKELSGKKFGICEAACAALSPPGQKQNSTILERNDATDCWRGNTQGHKGSSLNRHSLCNNEKRKEKWRQILQVKYS